MAFKLLFEFVTIISIARYCKLDHFIIYVWPVAVDSVAVHVRVASVKDGNGSFMEGLPLAPSVVSSGSV